MQSVVLDVIFLRHQEKSREMDSLTEKTQIGTTKPDYAGKSLKFASLGNRSLGGAL